MNLQRGTMKCCLYEMKVKKEYKKLTSNEIKRIRESILDGWTIQKIADEIGTSKGHVQYYASKFKKEVQKSMQKAVKAGLKENKNKTKKPPKKLGRPEKQLDLNIMETFVYLGATKEEICEHFEVSVTHLENVIRKNYDKTFTQLKAQKTSKRKIQLRQKQWEVAMGEGKIKPNSTMLIFLGKVELGQNDNSRYDEIVGFPDTIKIIHTGSDACNANEDIEDETIKQPERSEQIEENC